VAFCQKFGGIALGGQINRDRPLPMSSTSVPIYLSPERREWISANQRSNRRLVRCPALHRLRRFAAPLFAFFFSLTRPAATSRALARVQALSDSSAAFCAGGRDHHTRLSHDVAAAPDLGATRSSGRSLSKCDALTGANSRVTRACRDTGKMHTSAWCDHDLCFHATNEA